MRLLKSDFWLKSVVGGELWSVRGILHSSEPSDNGFLVSSELENDYLCADRARETRRAVSVSLATNASHQLSIQSVLTWAKTD
jgi:hypothetical protein